MWSNIRRKDGCKKWEVVKRWNINHLTDVSWHKARHYLDIFSKELKAQIASGINTCDKKQTLSQSHSQCKDTLEKYTPAIIINTLFAIVSVQTLWLNFALWLGQSNIDSEVYSRVSLSWTQHVLCSNHLLHCGMSSLRTLSLFIFSNYLDTSASGPVRSSVLTNDDGWAVRMTNTTAGPVSTR